MTWPHGLQKIYGTSPFLPHHLWESWCLGQRLFMKTSKLWCWLSLWLFWFALKPANGNKGLSQRLTNMEPKAACLTVRDHKVSVLTGISLYIPTATGVPRARSSPWVTSFTLNLGIFLSFVWVLSVSIYMCLYTYTHVCVHVEIRDSFYRFPHWLLRRSSLIEWDCQSNKPKDPLGSAPQCWAFRCSPPYLVFYIGAGIQTQANTLPIEPAHQRLRGTLGNQYPNENRPLISTEL